MSVARLVSLVCNGGQLHRGGRIQRGELFDAIKLFSFPVKSGNWLFDGPLSEREAAEPFYFRLLLNLASGMISSLANCRPFFSPFPHIPPSGGFCKVSNISMHKIIMAVTVDETFICSKLGARSFGDGSQGICKYKESNMGQVAGF